MEVAINAARYMKDDATRTSPYELDHGPPSGGPSRVGRYEIREVLGAGAMGVVYRAHDPELGRDVAIKLVRDSGASPSSGLRLLREAQAMARLHHPNVLPIFDVGPTDSAVFVAMPLLEGGTLRSWMDDRSRSFDAILDRFVAAGRGLAAAHAAGLIHRDFKPDNVLLGADGEVHVADFGLARLVDDDLTPNPQRVSSGEGTQAGAVLGTPAYMAPEQLRGLASDARADQFSFCVSLWEGLYGERPFPGPRPGTEHPQGARLATIAAGPTPPVHRDHPAWLTPLLVRGLALDPERRWPSMQALLDAIAAHRSRRRWPRWLAAGLGAIGLAAAVAALGQPPAAQIVPAPPAPAPAPTEPAAVRPVTPLAHYDDLMAAAISPDGTKLAFVTGDALVIRGSEIGAEDRTLVEHGITAPIAWSPDNRHLLVGAAPELAGVFRSKLVDIEDGAARELPMIGMASFLSSTEIGVVTSYRHRSIAIYRLGEPTAAATCKVPGDYTFLWSVAGLPDGTMVVDTEVLGTGSHTLVILGRDCQVRATFGKEPFERFATTDTGTLVALVARDGLDEILELSLDGDIVSRRRVSGALGAVIGRRHGADYVTTLAPKTDLIRMKAGVPQLVSSSGGNVSFQLAPDGETLAWIERDGRGQALGPLWLSTLQDMRRSRAVVDHALTVGWSPDGRRLAVLVADDARLASAHPGPAQHISSSLLVVDRSGAFPRRVPLTDLDPEAAPVWLDDHRIAARTDDRTTYHWIDLDTGEEGEIVDRLHGSTLWLTRSPRDGTLAMWRMGAPGAIDPHAEHLWLQPPRREARPLHVSDTKHFLVPSWSPTGELLVRAFETGVVSRVAQDTGELTPIATLTPTPSGRLVDDHVMTLANGDLLAVKHELGANVAVIRPER
jgi:hypothetical protein